VHMPLILPKVPGRFYYYFGKPLETKGMPNTYLHLGMSMTCFLPSLKLMRYYLTGRKQELRDKEKSHEFYLQVKSEVERCIDYLKVKRENDPYRSIGARLLYQVTHGFESEVPTFEI